MLYSRIRLYLKKIITHFILIFFIFHFFRILLVPIIFHFSGNSKYADTLQVLRSFGYRPTGPCSLPRVKQKCTIQERIHVILVSGQWDREPITRVETEMSIKSILSSTNCKLFFHFLITGESEEWEITDMMESIRAVPFDSFQPLTSNLARHDNHEMSEQISDNPDTDDVFDSEPMVGYSIHPIPVLWIREQANKIRINISHHSGEAGFSKLFIPQILWNVKRAIYIDVDMLFAEDIAELWKYFTVMDDEEDVFLFMGDNHPSRSGPRSLYPFCSCQLIMDLDRLRKSNLTHMILNALGDLKAEEVSGFRPGDQWVWTLMCKDNPHRCRILPKIWNVSGCSEPRFLGLNARYYGDLNRTCWKVAHFNCIKLRNNASYFLGESDWSDSVNYVQSLPWSAFVRES